MDRKVLINLLVELAVAEADLVAARQEQTGNRVRREKLGQLQDEIRRDAEQAESGEQETRKLLRSHEGELAATETQLAERRTLLPTLADDRQREAVHREIETLARRRDDLESGILLLLDEIGEETRTTREARREWREQEDRRLAAEDSMQDRGLRAAAREEQVEQEIARMLVLLPDAVRRQVVRLRGGLDRAIVFLEGQACGGCFAQLPQQQAITAERGADLIRCESCTRFVVHRPWS